MPELSLSVVIPAFNEAGQIEETLRAVQFYLCQRVDFFEIIVVDDGSTDSTAERVQDFIAKNTSSNIRLINYKVNIGKGYAVRRGMLSSFGKYALFLDADLSSPIQEIEKLLPFLKAGYELAIGSRVKEGSEILLHQPSHREFLGRVFNFLAQTLVISGIKDSQCGLKVFSQEAAKIIFTKSRINRFCFDVEILCIARNLEYKIKEAPVSWSDSRCSHLNVWRDPLIMFIDLLRIGINRLLGRYN